MRSQSQRNRRDFVTGISFDSAQERPCFLAGRDRGVVLYLGCRERAAQVSREITVGPCGGDCIAEDSANNAAHRSEEHTSELQSLMRTSYDVFCLNKQKHSNHSNYIIYS